MASQRSSTVSGRDHFEEGLEFREGHLDWIEVGTIRWQEAQLGASGVDGLADGDGLVSRQIVHDDNVAGFQRRHQHLFHIGQEGAAVHGAIEHHGRRHSLQSERADESGRLPMTVGHRRAAALAAPRHLGRGPCLVDKDEPLRHQVGLRLEPSPPPVQHVRALLFARVRGFF